MLRDVTSGSLTGESADALCRVLIIMFAMDW